MNAPMPSLPGVPLVESPFFYNQVDDLALSNHEKRIACDLHEKGYAVLRFPDEDFTDRADRLITTLTPEFNIEGWRENGWKKGQGLRLQDIWDRNEDVRQIAANPEILRLLSKLYGRKVFPFQTLNFPVGTQQKAHSDAVHFSSVPERFMVGVWVALEDIGPQQGPLEYYPGSHKWPMITNAMVDSTLPDKSEETATNRYREYLRYWQAMADEHKIKREFFHAKKGQALIWTSNLLHGGSLHKNPALTRWSQVTHYYFENCVYYAPRMSDTMVGRIHLKRPVDVETGQRVNQTYLGTKLGDIDPRG